MNAERSTRYAGLALIAGPVLSVVAMTHHPTAGAAGTPERLAEMASEGTLSAIVHGALIALMLLVFWGLTRFAGILGWHSTAVQLAAIAYATGVVCMLGAATVSGFVAPSLAERYAQATPQEMEAAAPLFRFGFEVNQALAKIGATAQSVGILLWSWVLVLRAGAPKWVRAVGALGLAVGAFPVLGLVSGSLTLDVHGMLAVVLAQAVWTIAIGVWLVGSRPADS